MCACILEPILVICEGALGVLYTGDSTEMYVVNSLSVIPERLSGCKANCTLHCGKAMQLLALRTEPFEALTLVKGD